MAGPPRVLLVCPRFNPNSFWSLDATCALRGARWIAPPLGLITLAAMLPPSWQLRLLNRNAEEMTDRDLEGVDLVMTGGMLAQETDTLEVMRFCQHRGVPVCIGGPAPTSTPDVYAHADFLVVGEAEGVIASFIADWEAGERRGRYDAPRFQADVTQSPVPRFDLLNFDHYLWLNVQFSRGCPFTCEFCDIIELYGRAPRTKTHDQMLAELDRLYTLGYRGHLDFVDDNLIGNKKAIKRFLPHLAVWQEERGYPFKLSTEASLNLADDPELLGMMRRANFFAVFVGIETPDEKTLVHTAKKQNARRSIADSVHRIYAAGLYVVAGFIVGFDTEEGSIADAMAACIRDTAIPTATVALLTALPTTQLMRRLEREGRLGDAYRQAMTSSGDMCTAGLNFATLRPRRDVLTDFRDVVAEVYRPAVYFERVRTMGRLVKRPWIRHRRIAWRAASKDALAGFRLLLALMFRYPELLGPACRTIADCLRHNPTAIEAVLRNIMTYLHLYPFAQYLVRTVDARIAEIDGELASEPAQRATAPELAAVA